MQTPEWGERLAALEEAQRGIRQDAAEQVAEMQRTRERVHLLEKTTQGLVMVNKQHQRERAQRDASIKLWLQVLTIVIGIAGILGPLIYSGAAHP